MAEFVLKISTLTLIEVFTNKCWVQGLLLIMLVSSSIDSKLVSWKHKLWTRYIDHIWMHE